MKVTLKNGSILEGTLDQITSTMRALGEEMKMTGWYHSSTHGWVEIRRMSDSHLRNAMLKVYREWVNSLSGLSDLQLINALRSNCTDETFISLLAEFITRTTGKR